MQTTERRTDYGKEVETKVQGRVYSLESTVLDFESGAIGVQSKHIPGTYLLLRTDGNEERLGFPRRFTLDEADMLTGEEVEYSLTYNFLNEGASGSIQGWHYRLTMKSGPFRDWTIQEELTV